MEAKPGNGSRRRGGKLNGSGHQRGGLLDEASTQVSQLAEWVRDESGEFLNARKNDAASELTKVSGAIRRAADKLTDQNRTAVAKYVETAAESVEQAGRYLEELELQQFMADAEAVARRRPALFLGGMFIVGLAAARFLKVAAATLPAEIHDQRATAGRAGTSRQE